MNIQEFYSEVGVTLVPSGDRWVSLCPFKAHKDSKPSFVVYKDGSYHCFGCGAHGSLRTIQKKFNVSYRPFPNFDDISDRTDMLLTAIKNKHEATLELELSDKPDNVRFSAYDKFDLLMLITKELSTCVGIGTVDVVSYVRSRFNKILEKVKKSA